jgi:hypothetical protein
MAANQLKAYLENGGALWIDNNGNYGDALVLGSTTNGNQITKPFIVDMRFDSTSIEDSYKVWQNNYMDVMTRFYTMGAIGTNA